MQSNSGFLGIEWNIAQENFIYIDIYMSVMGVAMLFLLAKLIYLVIKCIRKKLSGEKDPEPKELKELVVSLEGLVDKSPHQGSQVVREFADQLNEVLQGINAERDCKFNKADLVEEKIVFPLARAMIKAKFNGIRKGYWTFAVWRDSTEYVGSSGKTLKQAVAELDEEENKFLSIIEGRKVC